MTRQWMRWALLAACTATSGCGACGTPRDMTLEGDPTNGVVIEWRESSAMGLYFTEPDAVIPAGPDDMVVGYPYWVIEATSFPGGFDSPVMYGTPPGDAADATEAHGGLPGGEPLQCGVTYKVTVVALRGEDELEIEWPCE